MPLYEYHCESCQKRFEVIQRFADAPVEVCRVCGGGPVERLLSAPAIQFKGSGWYITDYARKGKNEPATVGAARSSEEKSHANGSSSDAATPASTDSKPAASAKPETKS